MLAVEARKLSESSKQQYNEWLQGAIEKIKKSSINGKNKVFIYLGEGSYHNNEFSKMLNAKEQLLRNLGYKTRKEMESSWNSIFYKTFKYWLKVEW